MTFQEKRKRHRVKLATEILLDFENNKIDKATSVDISMNGVLFTTNFSPGIGKNGKLTVVMKFCNDNLNVHANYEVVRVTRLSSLSTKKNNSFEVGVMLTYIDSISSINLFNIIKYQEGGDLNLINVNAV